jgi:hypothetical protein
MFMETEGSALRAVIGWMPFIIQIAISIWLTLKLIRVLQTMADAHEGILTKLNDVDRRLAANGILPPDAK